MQINRISYIQPNKKFHNNVTSAPYFYNKLNSNSLPMDTVSFGSKIPDAGKIIKKEIKPIKGKIIPLPLRAPIYKNPVDSAYSDTVGFSRKIAESVNKSVGVMSQDDIRKLVSKISEASELNIQDTRELVLRLVQFSNYQCLPEIGKALEHHRIGNFYEPPILPLQLNAALKYVGMTKQNFFNEKLLKFTGKKEAFFIDKDSLDFIRYLKEEEPAHYDELEKNISKGKIKLMVLDGSNFKIDNRYTSCTFLEGQKNLESYAIELAKRRKKYGFSFDALLNRKIIEEAKEVFEDENADISIIRNESAISRLKEDKKTDYSLLDKVILNVVIRRPFNLPRIQSDMSENISRWINPRTPKPSDYYATIKGTAKTMFPSAEDEDYRKNAELFYASFIDHTLNVETPTSMSERLKKVHSRIIKELSAVGRDENNIFYLNPKTDSSFSLINYMYGKANKVDMPFLSDFTTKYISREKDVIVVLDDIAASGLTFKSIYEHVSDLNTLSKKYFVSMFHTPFATRTMNKEFANKNRIGEDLFIGGPKLTTLSDYHKLLNADEKKRCSEAFNQYMDGITPIGTSAICFPHMAPDINSMLVRSLLDGFLINPMTNKTPHMMSVVYSDLERNIKNAKNEYYIGINTIK